MIHLQQKLNTSTAILSTVGSLHKILWSAYTNKLSYTSASIVQPRLSNKIWERLLSAPHAAKIVKDEFELGSGVIELDMCLPLYNNLTSTSHMSASLANSHTEYTPVLINNNDDTVLPHRYIRTSSNTIKHPSDQFGSELGQLLRNCISDDQPIDAQYMANFRWRFVFFNAKNPNAIEVTQIEGSMLTATCRIKQSEIDV